MPKVADLEPMEIKFESEEERDRFIRWVEDKNTANHPDMVEMRKRIRDIRLMRTRIKQWPPSK